LILLQIISDILVCVGITDLKDLANTALSCSQLAESIYQVIISASSPRNDADDICCADRISKVVHAYGEKSI
jgi:hypothetical protein